MTRLVPASLLTPPSPLATLAALCSVLAALPLGYVAMRASQAGPNAWGNLLTLGALRVAGTSLLLAVAVALTCAVLALILGWLTQHTDLWGGPTWVFLLAAPLGLPSYLGAYTMVALFAPGGLVANFVPWSPYGFGGTWLCLTLWSFPYALLPVQAAYRQADPALEEAAQTLGASRWRIFWRVTFPQVAPALRGGSLLVALYTLSDFGAVSLLRVDTFTRVLFVQFESTLDREGMAVLALVLAAMALGILLASQRDRTLGVRGARITRPKTRTTLGRWQVPSCLLVGGLVSAALAAPVIVVGTWATRATPTEAAREVAALGNALAATLQGAIGAALAATLLALPIALWAARHHHAVMRGWERVAYLGFGTPGVVVGLSLVFFSLRYLPWSYQTLGLLVLAYTLRFLPQAISAQKGTLLLRSPAWTEAARTLGASPWRAFRRITLPWALPGLGSGAALVFLTTVKELPCTLILAPLDYDTLATSLWSHTAEAAFDQAAFPALVLLALSALSTALTLHPGRAPSR